MDYKTIKLDIDKGVATVTFNRPDKRNAMSPTFHREMTHVLDRLQYDEAVTIIVLTGAGPAFCAGMDLKEFFTDLNDQPAEYDRVTKLAVEWRYRTLRYMPKVTIAMINGYCFGGAFGIVEGCDIAIAAEEATFGLSEINFKIFPGGVVSKAMANLMRPRDALYYGLTGKPFDGREAARIGFVTYAVPLAQLQEETMTLARDLARKDPVALRATKEGYRYSLEMSSDASFSYTAAKEAQVRYLQDSAWLREGIGDFLGGKYRPGLGGHEDVA